MSQEVELNLRLDADGRTSVDPTKLCDNSDASRQSGESSAAASVVDYSSKTIMSQLAASQSEGTKESQTLLDDLLFDAEIADCGLLPRTFWIPCEGMKPRCRLEQMALEVFQHHVPKGCVYDASTSGAEWWVQIRPSPPAGRYSMHAQTSTGTKKDAGDSNSKTSAGDQDMSKSGISFHWDKDENLRLAMGGEMYIHPHLSTVTYLTAFGAPTMAINYRVNNLNGEYIRPKACESYLSWPKQGKHLSFDGGFLHAAPEDLMDDGEFERQCNFDASHVTNEKELQLLARRHRRVTFLVNIWLNYKPLHVDCFPATMIDKLSVHDNSAGRILFIATNESTDKEDCEGATLVACAPQNNTDDNNNVSTKIFTWPMGGCDSEENIKVTMPIDTIKTEKASGGNVRIQWKQQNTAAACDRFSGVTILKGVVKVDEGEDACKDWKKETKDEDQNQEEEERPVTKKQKVLET